MASRLVPAAVLVAVSAVIVSTSHAAASTRQEALVHRTAALRATNDSVIPTAVSSNWAGYAVGDVADESAQAAGAPTASFTSVTGTWKQPRATCAPGDPTYSSVWVGLGGFSSGSKALEQIGTDANCTTGGKAAYGAWYELVPAPPVYFKVKILPGDTVTASVNVDGPNVVVQLKNRTRHTSFTKQLSMAAPDLSTAEWIAEAPSQCDPYPSCHPLPLANFGSVAITKIATRADGHPGTITDPAWSATAIELVPDSGRPGMFGRSSSASGAAPAALSPDGRSFTVAWQPASSLSGG